PALWYRPPSLVVGVGCRRGVGASEIDELFQYLCRTRGFAPLSLGLVATASIKAEEPGIKEFARLYDVPVLAFSLDEIARVTELPNPSDQVKAKIGVFGVAEPTAMLAAKTNRLLVEKYASKRIAMALARRENA